MTINPEWESIFRTRAWGQYPDLELVRYIKKHFAQRTGPRFFVLELGCGAGANLRMLHNEGFHVFGIDGSPEAVHQTNRLCGQVATLGDVSKLSEIYTSSLRFDLICDVGCFMHQKKADREKIVKDCYNLLNPGGRVFFSEMVSQLCSAFDDSSTPDDEGDLCLVSDKLFQPKIGYHFFSHEELLNLFSDFTDIELEISTRSYANRKRFYDRFYLGGKKP